jgi:hypothetical protein
MIMNWELYHKTQTQYLTAPGSIQSNYHVFVFSIRSAVRKRNPTEN